MRKEETTINDLLKAINIFSNLGIKYWLDGGWGVDLLYGKQTREHRDIDIDFDALYVNEVVKILIDNGYIMETNELPVRAELYSKDYGYIDIHPFEIDSNGCIRQANPESGFFEFESSWFGSVKFMGSDIPCISLDGQFVFHSGYELRDKDYHDLNILNITKQK